MRSLEDFFRRSSGFLNSEFCQNDCSVGKILENKVQLRGPNCFSSPSRTSLQILDHFTPHRVKPPQLSNKFFHLRFLINNQILTFATCSKCRGYEIKTFMITRIMDAFFLLYPFLSTSHVLHLFLLTLKYNSN